MAHSEQHTLDQTQVRRKASRYILETLGDRLWAGVPTYDDDHKQWTVPIHTQALQADVALGEISLDPAGRVVRAPSRRTLQRAVQRHQPPDPAESPAASFVEAMHDLLTGGVPAFAGARGGEAARDTQPAAEPAPTLETLGRDLQQLFQDDPELLTAFVNLRTALADPHLRRNVLTALEAFAKAAKRGDD